MQKPTSRHKWWHLRNYKIDGQLKMGTSMQTHHVFSRLSHTRVVMFWLKTVIQCSTGALTVMPQSAAMPTSMFWVIPVRIFYVRNYAKNTCEGSSANLIPAYEQSIRSRDLDVNYLTSDLDIKLIDMNTMCTLWRLRVAFELLLVLLS